MPRPRAPEPRHARAGRRRRTPLGLAAMLALAAAVTGCAPNAGAGSPSGDADGLEGELRISAAASLSRAFDELADRFEARHPSVDALPISYDGSSTLATQIIEGAPADVLATADEDTMQAVVDAGRVADPQVFATNTLVIAVPAGNPGAVAGIGDLADPALTVVLCAPEVPCGAASTMLLSGQGVSVTPASIEQNVTAVLTKVAVGEADAGLVYATDALGDDRVEAVAASGADEVVNLYPIGVVGDARNPAVATAFVDFVRSAEGRGVLADLGFGAP